MERSLRESQLSRSENILVWFVVVGENVLFVRIFVSRFKGEDKSDLNTGAVTFVCDSVMDSISIDFTCSF